jgi:hypothetical protein
MRLLADAKAGRGKAPRAHCVINHLLAPEYEAVSLVEFDPTPGGRSILVEEWHGAIENVSVFLVVGPRRIGPGAFEEIT